MKKRVLWIIIIILLIAAGAAGFTWWRERQTAQAQVEVLRTTEVVRDSLNLTRAASGNVSASRTVDLSFETAGIVADVAVEVGDRVEAGQVLASLDDDAQEDAITQAQLALEQARVNLDALLSPPDEEDLQLAQLAIQEAAQAMQVAKLSEALSEARAAFNQEQAQDIEEDLKDAYEGYLDVLDDYGIPEAYAAGITAAYMEAQGNVGITQLRGDYAIQQARSQWFSAYERYAQAQRNLELLEQGPTEEQVQQLELQIEQAQINLEQAQTNLDMTRLKAPFSGVIASVNAQESTPIPVTVPAMTLMDDTAYYVDLAVDEIDIGMLQEGQSVTVTLDAFPMQPLPGVVDRITALPEVSGGVIVYPVRIQLTSTGDVDVRDGMTASATIITGRREDILLVPNWAIRTDQTTAQTYTYCYCIAGDGEPKQVVVEIGVRNDEFTEITAGLEEGATVALVTEGRNILDFQGPPSDGRP